MKFQIFQILAVAVILAISANAENITYGNYQVMENALNKPIPSEFSEYFELDEDVNSIKETEMEIPEGETTPELEPLGHCFVIKCFPKRTKLKVCICIKYKKVD